MENKKYNIATARTNKDLYGYLKKMKGGLKEKLWN